MKLKGVCLHHDMSGLGAAVPLRAMQRRLAILKSIGVNAIRTSHNPFDPMVLDLFDQMGFLVMDEFFDVWTQSKYSMKDYSVNWAKWHVTDATDIVKQHRNHPSIIIYSIGNEIRDALATRTPIATELVKICHTNDSTRPVTQGLFRPLDNKDYPGSTLSILDVFGVNYHTTELLSAITENTPHHSGVMTEDVPSTSSWNTFYAKNPQITGGFLWTGAAYLGEATQTDAGWPYVGGSNKDGEFGLIDRVGTIKDIGYSYQGIWSTNPVNKPKTSTAAATKVLLTVDHPTITTDWEDVAYVKATVVDASGNIVTNSNVSVEFTVSGTAGEIKAVDSGIYEAGESFRGNTRKAYKGICFAIVQMSTVGSITISASASGLTGSSVTVTGTSGSFVPCPTCD
jgi:beta-galactosidase